MDNLRAMLGQAGAVLVCAMVGHRHDCRACRHLCTRCGRLFL